MTTASGSHFRRYYLAWSELTSPLRPHRDVVSAVKDAIGTPGGPTLLLGVTPELADVAAGLVAVDRNHSMIANIWPGNTGRSTALVGDWMALGFRSATFAACVGDGSLIAAHYPSDHAVLFAEIARVLCPGATLVLRAYVRPDAGDTALAVRQAALDGGLHDFHAFKLRLATALACDIGDPNVPVQHILDTFNAMFPDRAHLVRRTGWRREHIDTIDFYDGSTARYSFPSRGELLAAVPATHFVGSQFLPSGTYELAEACPLLAMRRI